MKGNEGVRLTNRISKMQKLTDLHNYLKNSVIFYILPILNQWLKSIKLRNC